MKEPLPMADKKVPSDKGATGESSVPQEFKDKVAALMSECEGDEACRLYLTKEVENLETPEEQAAEKGDTTGATDTSKTETPAEFSGENMPSM